MQANPQSSTPQRSPHVPSYRKKTVGGRVYGCVTLDGRDRYLGEHGTPESQDRYRELVARWLANGGRLPDDNAAADVSVSEVLLAFLRDCERRFVDRRHAGTLLSRIRVALKAVRELYGTTSAAAFSPKKLLAVRERWIACGRYGRKSVNEHAKIVKAAWKYAALQELVPASVWHGLLTVGALRCGDAPIREPRKVHPVPQEFVDAALPYMRPQVAAMVRLQLLTGMRAGEVTIMRTADIDVTGKVWTYAPAVHKSQSKGCDRQVFIGPAAQAVLRPWLRTDLTTYIFSPREAEQQRDADRGKHRQTPRYPSHVKAQARRRKRNPKRAPRDHYTTATYANAIWRACDRADDKAKRELAESGQAVPAERIVPRWGTHQLRHSFASRVRREHGLELARVLLGHAVVNLSVTERYADADSVGAKAIVAKIG